MKPHSGRDPAFTKTLNAKIRRLKDSGPSSVGNWMPGLAKTGYCIYRVNGVKLTNKEVGRQYYRTMGGATAEQV